MKQLRIRLQGLKVSKSEASEPKEEEDEDENGKPKIMEGISGYSAGEVLKKNSRNFLNRWG